MWSVCKFETPRFPIRILRCAQTEKRSGALRVDLEFRAIVELIWPLAQTVPKRPLRVALEFRAIVELTRPLAPTVPKRPASGCSRIQGHCTTGQCFDSGRPDMFGVALAHAETGALLLQPWCLALATVVTVGPFFKTQAFLAAFKHAMDTLGIEPRASRMLSGCDTTTPCAPCWS